MGSIPRGGILLLCLLVSMLVVGAVSSPARAADESGFPSFLFEHYTASDGSVTQLFGCGGSDCPTIPVGVAVEITVSVDLNNCDPVTVAFGDGTTQSYNFGGAFLHNFFHTYQAASTYTLVATMPTCPGSYTGTSTITVGNTPGPISSSSSTTSSFDFSISVTPATVTVGRGGAAVYTVSVNLVRGTPQTVSLQSLTSNAAPPGFLNAITAGFGAASGVPPFTTTLTIQTSDKTPNATVTEIVRGVGGGAAHDATMTLVVTASAQSSVISTTSLDARLGGPTSSTTSLSQTPTNQVPQPSASLNLTAPYGQVLLCDSNGNNCNQASAGHQLQPGECISTLSASGIVVHSSNMDIAIGENSHFCLPATRAGISSLCTQSLVYATIEGNLHVGTFGLSLGQNVYIRTPYMGVCDKGTEFTLQSSGGGTTAMVLSDSLIAIDLRSNASVLVSTNQTISVPSSGSGMSPEVMLQAVQSFDPNSVNQWWLSSGPSDGSSQAATSTFGYLGKPWVWVILAVLAGALVAISRRAVRRRKMPSGTTS